MKLKIGFYTQFKPKFEGFYFIQEQSRNYKVPLEEGSILIKNGLLTLEEYKEDIKRFNQHKICKTKKVL